MTLSAKRIWDRCEELARLSESDGGLTRVFLSKEHRKANALVMDWMCDAGMNARVDAIGNVAGRYEGVQDALSCLILGSHLDTVRDAGKYDGMLGVVTAIECVASLNSRGRRMPFAIEVLGFADEEGVRFNATLLGSRAVAGSFDAAALDRQDKDGVTMRDALKSFGLDPNAIASAARRREDILAYVELHIEQGPVLENEGLPVGIVTTINGATRCAVEIDGTAGHAGTVPMTLRKDALAAAAECVLAIERRCMRDSELVGTVGKLEALPGAVNVIPGRVYFSIDVRAPEDDKRMAAIADIVAEMKEICARRGVAARIEKTHEGATAACAGWLMVQIGAAISAEGVSVRPLPSGAGHDGMAMVNVADIGMLFVRCTKGVSHSPAEAVTLDDVATGARVLLRFIEHFEPRRQGRTK
jgi:allantoate deiminase